MPTNPNVTQAVREDLPWEWRKTMPNPNMVQAMYEAGTYLVADLLIVEIVQRMRGDPRHGHCRNGRVTPTYLAWVSMHSRCRPQYFRHESYFDRGIRVCHRWSEFESFLEDMGERPAGRYSLDRIDNDIGYQPGNCRWATLASQNRNMRRTVRVQCHGTTMALSEACAILGVKYKTVRQRMKDQGMSFEEACTKPVRRWPAQEGGQ